MSIRNTMVMKNTDMESMMTTKRHKANQANPTIHQVPMALVAIPSLLIKLYLFVCTEK